ncbi:undecaprenyl-phosphate glucose phosphotransferase [Methylobacter sp.]|uniref:undecaprenyl-phosphate glucose phosphotransferase n=1 Tax=Methylobacter sp. TaxID=2051955 RepID=UPI003DA59899
MNSTHKFGIIRPHSNKLIALARLLDVIVIGLTLWAILDLNATEWDRKQTWWLLISIVVFGIFAEFNELYRQSRGLSIHIEIKRILFSWFWVLVVIMGIDQAYPLVDPVYRYYFWMWIGAVPVEIVSWHIIVSSIAGIIRKKGRNTRRAAIVGANRLGVELKNIFAEEESMGLHFVGFYDDEQETEIDGGALAENKLKGNFQQLIKDAKGGAIDIVYITLPLRTELKIKELIEQLSDSTVSVYYVPDLFVFDLLRSSLHHIKGIPVISIRDTPFYGVDGVIKRAFDIVVSLIILILIAIPLLIISASVRISSPGAVIFKQRRYGIGGEEIVVWKFRTMTVSEDDNNIKQARKNDPRVTRLGAFLRRTSLDELPQFINVLQGKMSIVGPRPHAVAHNEWYRGQIKGYMLRHIVKPGITGYAQINGYRGETDTLDKMEKRIQYDLAYIRNWSLWLDIKIVILTVFKGFLGAKAY